jgi:hypothetical protein
MLFGMESHNSVQASAHPAQGRSCPQNGQASAEMRPNDSSGSRHLSSIAYN